MGNFSTGWTTFLFWRWKKNGRFRFTIVTNRALCIQDLVTMLFEAFRCLEVHHQWLTKMWPWTLACSRVCNSSIPPTLPFFFFTADLGFLFLLTLLLYSIHTTYDEIGKSGWTFSLYVNKKPFCATRAGNKFGIDEKVSVPCQSWVGRGGRLSKKGIVKLSNPQKRNLKQEKRRRKKKGCDPEMGEPGCAKSGGARIMKNPRTTEVKYESDGSW